MNDLAVKVEPAVRLLLVADETQLYEQLGIRLKAIVVNPAKAGSFEPEVAYDPAEMGLKEDVLELGKRVFHRWAVEAHKLVCGSAVDDLAARQDLVNAFGVGDATVAATLTAILVSQLGISPALAAVMAVIVCKRFFRPAYEEFCGAWGRIVAA
jgi:hypothetical protein